MTPEERADDILAYAIRDGRDMRQFILTHLHACGGNSSGAVDSIRQECCAAICVHCRVGREVFDKGWSFVHEFYDEETGLMLYNVECKANSIRRLQ